MASSTLETSVSLLKYLKYRFIVEKIFLNAVGTQKERKTGLGPATPTLARSCSTN